MRSRICADRTKNASVHLANGTKWQRRVLSRALLATREASAHSDSNGSRPGGNCLVDRRRNLRQNKITRRDLLFVSPRDQARRANQWHPRYDPTTIFSDRRDAKCKQPASAFLLSLQSCASCEAYNAGPIQGMSLQQDFACHDLQGRRGRREKSWRRLDGQNQSPKVILSDRKLKLPPPDPFRHQDSAIALRRGPSGAIGEVAMTLDLGNARSAVKPGTLKLSCGGAQHAYHGHL